MDAIGGAFGKRVVVADAEEGVDASALLLSEAMQAGNLHGVFGRPHAHLHPTRWQGRSQARQPRRALGTAETEGILGLDTAFSDDKTVWPKDAVPT